MASVFAEPAREPEKVGGLGSAYPKQVPASRAVRERIRARAWQIVNHWDRSRPLSQEQIEFHSRALLAELAEPIDYLGWTMVMLGSAFWQAQVAAVPIERRLLLLPHCFRSVEKCQGAYTAQELVCRDCGACRLCYLRAEAQRLGYQVLIAEGTPIVVDMILHGRVDAILGVACLNSLERALDKILRVGIPCMAVPLWESRCRDSQTDEDWILEMLHTPYVPAAAPTETYLHLLRASVEMFRPERLAQLLPSFPSGPTKPSSALRAPRPADRTPPSPAEPSQAAKMRPSAEASRLEGVPLWETTEHLAYDFLLRGGKHLRPFFTLAAYDAMTGAHALRADGRTVLDRWPEAVWQVALAIEIFHKASLIHDDIEDDDPYRYGRPALHREHGVPLALNAGDFLIGLGYRLAAQGGRQFAPEVAVDILTHLAQAHTRLCEGQGAELAWRQANSKRLSPLEVLKIYAFKTAPAFEAALYGGLRMAAPVESIQETIARYARHVGVGFQIRNDLADWTHDYSNKRTLGADVLGARPTILWALARETLPTAEVARLDQLLAESVQWADRHGHELGDAPGAAESRSAPSAHAPPPNDASAATRAQTLLAEVRSLYQKADVFSQAEALVEKHLQRAHDLADTLSLAPLRRLLHYGADMVLKG